MKVRSLLLAVSVVVCSPLWLAASHSTPQAEAAVSIAYSLPELLHLSTQVAVVRATEKHSQWEHVAGSKRIVTYTRLAIVESVVGRNGKAKSLWVRTLGGAVGRIGQQVAGEARFRLNKESLVFLTRSTDKRWLVTGMAQGHFPVVPSKSKAKGKDGSGAKAKRQLAPSPSLGVILRRKGPSISAQEVLIGKALRLAINKVRDLKSQIDADK
jgi:hypothetical protein